MWTLAGLSQACIVEADVWNLFSHVAKLSGHFGQANPTPSHALTGIQ